MSWVVADSSFYLCFLEDIECPDHLVTILGRLDFMATGIIFAEVSRCRNFGRVQSGFRVKHSSLDADISKVLRPLFSEAQWLKGEADAIGLAFSLSSDGQLSKLILDDDQARSIVERNIDSLKAFMTGTVGFVGFCAEWAVVSRDTALQILVSIEGSGFRVTDEVLSNVRKRIMAIG